MNFRTFLAKNVFGEVVAFQEQEISIMGSANFLGIKLDLNLSWSDCTETIAKRLDSSTYQMLVLIQGTLLIRLSSVLFDNMGLNFGDKLWKGKQFLNSINSGDL